MVYDDEPIFGVFESVPIKVDLCAPKGCISPLFLFDTHNATTETATVAYTDLFACLGKLHVTNRLR